MASRKRPKAAKGTYARQEAVRRRGTPGKRFVGETAGQSADARQRERKKVARMARAARKAKPAEAARKAGARKPAKRRTSPEAAPSVPRIPEAVELRAAEADAARAGAEIEPVERPLATVSRLPPASAPGIAGEADAEPGARAVAPDAWQTAPPAEPADGGAQEAVGDAPPPPGRAFADLARSALGLAGSVLALPLRFALAVPRLALRAVLR